MDRSLDPRTPEIDEQRVRLQNSLALKRRRNAIVPKLNQHLLLQIQTNKQNPVQKYEPNILQQIDRTTLVVHLRPQKISSVRKWSSRNLGLTHLIAAQHSTGLERSQIKANFDELLLFIINRVANKIMNNLESK